MCFYRRSEVSSSVLSQADKHHWGTEGNSTTEVNNSGSDPNDTDDEDSMNDEKSEKAQLRQREVFLSRQCETLPATLIRGKCSVTLLSEVENAQSYLGRDDAFFYALVYDPHAKTLVADRGEIRIGSNYQVYTTLIQIIFSHIFTYQYHTKIIINLSTYFVNHSIQEHFQSQITLINTFC